MNLRIGICSVLALLSSQQMAWGQNSVPVCEALVSSANDLFLISSGGDVKIQFTTDGLQKGSVSLAPDSQKVAYIPGADHRKVTLVDERGDTVTRTVQEIPNAVFTNVEWNTDSILATEYSLGQRDNVFSYHFVRGKLWEAQMRSRRSVQGENCVARALERWDYACVNGAEVEVGGGIIYSADAFAPASAKTVGSLSIRLGTSSSSATTPPFGVELVSVSDGVTLKITLPTGNWIQQRVQDGEPIALTLDDIVYGFIPKVTNRTKNIVQVNIVQSLFGDSAFDRAVGWYDDGVVAVVERPQAGPRLLLLADHKRDAADRQIGGALNIPVPLQSMRFVRKHENGRRRDNDNDGDQSLLIFKTLNGYGYVPVSVSSPEKHGSVPSLNVGPITYLPSTITASLPSGKASVDVLDWNCSWPMKGPE